MITMELIQTDEWKRMVNDLIEIKVGACDDDIEVIDKLTTAASHYYKSNERNLTYLGKLLNARNNIAVYGGGVPSCLHIEPEAELWLFHNDLAEINVQLEAIAMFELEIVGAKYDDDIRDRWVFAADSSDQVAQTNWSNGFVTTQEQSAHLFLTALLLPFTNR